jgi:hypothetical protein
LRKTDEPKSDVINKEKKEMNRFTLRSALVLAVLVLLAGATTSFAQFTGGAVSVTATTIGVTPLLKGEGVTEAVGDITLTTANTPSGGYTAAYANTTVGGTAAATLQISLTYSSTITNKSLGPVTDATPANARVIKAATNPGISITPAAFVGFGAATSMSWVAAGNTLTITISVPAGVTLTFPASGTSFLTIHGVRVNASAVSSGGFVSTLVGAGSSTAAFPFTVAFSFMNPLPVGAVQAGLDKTSDNNTRVLAKDKGLTTALGTALTGKIAKTAVNFPNCGIGSIPSASTLDKFPALVLGVRITEGYPGAFTTKALEITKSDTEVDNGTNFKLTFTNVPATVTLAIPQAINATTSGTAVLTNGGQLTLVGGTGTDATIYELRTGSTITVTYLTGTPNTSTTPAQFWMAVALFKAGSAIVDAPISIGVAVSIAPTTVDTSSGVTRYLDSGITGTANTTTCITNILFPFVTNKAGFDTGISVANAGQDHNGTSTQSGGCVLKFYDGTTTGKTPAVTYSGWTSTSPIFIPGSAQTTLVSTAAPLFQGYAIATCNFQYAHGFAMVVNGYGTLPAPTLMSVFYGLVFDEARPADGSHGANVEALVQ